ncbi:MAG: HlyD family efflux transporter periplasmic adaptor subunit [Pseudomonadota bacterium]
MSAVTYPDHQALPALREELRILRGAPLISGAPSWLIFDPVRHKYFQIGQDTFGLLAHWKSGTVGKLREALSSEGGMLDDAQLARLVTFLDRSNLTLAPAGDAVRVFEAQSHEQKRSATMGMLHRYLFWRIPLFRPSRFLDQTLWLAEPFFSRLWWVVVVVLGVLGVYLTSRQWEEFTTTFLHFISIEGALLYAVSLIGVKVLHELGHAYAATRSGCRVPTMGIAFIVLWPVLYTDTTDAWRLRDRRTRLLIDGAGIMVELMLAAIALFLWAFLDDGPLRSVAFTVATIGIVSSLLINLNPFMRFDGYYLLSDAIGVQNLQACGFALGRWQLREILFGLGEEPPENLPRAYRAGLVAYAWGTWIYRFFLFIAIALLVYTLFFKVLGIFLFIVEIIWFILRPIFAEVREWWKMRREIRSTRRSWLTLAFVGSLLAAAVIPWHGTVRVQGVMEVANAQRVYTSQPGQIAVLNLEEGAQVATGDILVTLQDPALDHAIDLSQSRILMLRERVRRGALDSAFLAEARISETELAAERQALSALETQRAELTVQAPNSGTLRDVDPLLKQGLWLPDRAVLAEIVGEGASEVRAYLPGDALVRLEEGTGGEFVPDDPAQPRLAVRLSRIASVATEEIELPYLASTYGGDIAVDRDGEKLLPRKAQYKLTAEVLEGELASGRMSRGALRLDAEPESFAYGLYRRAIQIFIREAGV